MADQLDEERRRRGSVGSHASAGRVEMTPEELTERLVEIGRAVDGVLAAKGRQERLALLAALMAGPLRAALNAAWRSRREEVEAILVRLSGGPGLGDSVSKLRAALRSSAKASAAGLTLVGEGDEASPVYRATIGGREVQLDVPAGWTCGDDVSGCGGRSPREARAACITHGPKAADEGARDVDQLSVDTGSLTPAPRSRRLRVWMGTVRSFAR